MADLVLVRNNGDKDIRVAYNSRPVIIPAGEERPLDREAAAIHFGDWTKRNQPEHPTAEIRDARKIEFARLKALYGGSPLLMEHENGKEVFEQAVPHVSLKEMDGTPIVGILDDPEGADLPIEGRSVQDTQAVISAMQEQMEKMAARIEELQSPVETVDIPEDTPERGRRKLPRVPEIAEA